jgi:hypothetical protein
MAERARLGAKKSRADDEDETNTIAEFEKFLLIDKNGLDDALIQQPDLIYRVSDMIATLISQRDAAKQSLSEAEAEADELIRRDAAEREVKITADAVRAQVKLDTAVIKRAERLAKLTFLTNKWSALKEAFVARGHALRELVSLHGNNYWSDASSGRASARNRDRDGDSARDAMAQARRRER